ncbi:hypothetical protein ASPZODRAFT_18875 [Penicilliopsis zonata CBS 506.65]|uniref:Uncharacterized protein n=1 Tax=Penicilliopsis zonata CBS 506.65 TaxID=1073090 RepID=A0A1L9SAC7_9EURO|nr:hypothetical protein ASPZODRAFT_18875 [Penicilliopsis zonata CBS 506.65]OJJ44108.1 hypothetical protein ASPZODRAFT_18875 [Penicilliopsis zonata CBS 506.65]
MPSSPAPCRSQRQPSTRRTTTQRKVYGKRKAVAAKAVFEQGSPVKASGHVSASVVDATLDEVEEKLGNVAIEDKEQALEEKREIQLEKEEQDVLVEDPVEDLVEKPSQSPSETVHEEASQTAPQESFKQYETMVEVRVCSPRVEQGETADCASVQDVEPETSQVERRKGRNHKPAPRRSSGCIQDEKMNAYTRIILDEALSPLASQGVQKFDSWAARAGNLFEVVKLAEGSYGEVYKLHLREEVCKREMSKAKLARLKAYGDGVFKIVPLRAKSGFGSKKFTSIDEIVAEVKMLKYLDPIPGFARFRDIHVVQGRFPESFQQAWMHYKKTKNDCLNPNPASKRAYPDSQLWAIVEMDDAGCELEKFSWSSIFQIYDIFWGVAMALARAEEYASFEHRDLHLGNVCIRSSRPDGSMDPPSDLDVARFHSSSGFGLSTLETTIIDYSLSRAELRLTEDPDVPAEIASSDLDKKQIFDAIGRDEDEVLLRNTYRYMRGELYSGDPLVTEKVPAVPGIWSEYVPRTNLVWLLFLLKNLLKNRRPEAATHQDSTLSPPRPQRKPLEACSPNKNLSRRAPGQKKAGVQELGKSSAKRQVTDDLHIQANLLKNILEDRLSAVLDLLDLENRPEDMCCAADLVAYAIDSQWLTESDFF